ncbi:MAG: VWA domain-containing protein [Magnetococcus sp. DMHC-6]
METGFHLAWPWMILALPLPWLVYRFVFSNPVEESKASLLVPFFQTLQQLERLSTSQRPLNGWVRWLASLIWLLLVLAALCPEWLDPPLELPTSGRDLMLAVDLSGSMQTPDFELNGQRVDRLTAIQNVAARFIERRVGDRLGLILFGDNAYLQTPLTFDRKVVALMLKEAVIGLAGEKTSIGDALGLAVKRMRDLPGQSRVIILLTDGANTAGMMEPETAARLAAQEKIKLYTIGMGSTEPMPVPGLFGTRMVDPSRDLDEKRLTTLAETTGGRYFRASATESLEEIYHLIDQLEPTLDDKEIFIRRQALYPWLLGPALLLSFVLIVSFLNVGEKIRNLWLQINWKRRPR